MKKKPGKGHLTSAVLRRRSPVPPPGGPMGRNSYDRASARKAARKAAEDALPANAARPLEPEEAPAPKPSGGPEEE
jgi:hypothetical protein